LPETAVAASARSFEPSALAAALNDSTQATIGNPRRGSYYVSIAISAGAQDESVILELGQLGVEYRINTRRRDGQRFVAIYSVESLRKMLQELGPELDPVPRDALETLVRARSPVPEDIVEGVWQRYNVDGWTAEKIAEAMTAKPIIDGMGKGWTARKVQRILAEV
jgi:hypothetical protein